MTKASPNSDQALIEAIAKLLNDLVNAEKRGVRLLTGTGR